MNTRTYRGLLIANSTFPSDPHNLPNLEGPRNDAALLRDALCDREFGLFASDNVRLVQERAMSEVLREIEDFLRSASRQDTLLLYYSGHGVLDQSSEFFLCTHNTRSDRLRSTAVKASDVRDMIDESAAQTTLIFLDCCHSGRFKGGDVPATLEGRGRFVVTSSRSGELANDAHALNHASLFTHHLVEGLRGRAVDHDHDGVVNLSELYDYVHDALGSEGKQVPQKRFEGSGEIPIALRPAAIDDPAPEGLVAPAAATPVLDVSDTVIDLGEIGADEVLPPERIVVINRGGGTLEWTVQSSADWVETIPGETGVELRLQPKVGPNRANIYISDTKSGLLKTVRLRVRVRPAVAPAADTSGEVLAVAPTARVEPVLPPPHPVPVAPTAIVEPVVLPPPDPEPVDPPAPVEPVVTPVVESEPERAEPVDIVETFEISPTDSEPELLEPDVMPWSGLAPTAPATEPRARRRSLAAVGRRCWPIAGFAGLAAGLIALYTAIDFADAIASNQGGKPLLREEWGPGLLESAIAGGALALAGAATFVRRWRRPALGAVGAMALLVLLLRTAEVAQFDGDTWMAAAKGFSDVRWLLVLAVLASGVAVADAWRRPAALARFGIITAALAGLWTLTLSVYVYDHPDDFQFGDHIDEREGGGSWQVLAGLLIVVLVVMAATALADDVGRGVLIGTAVLPVAAVAAEIAFLVDWGPPDLGAVADRLLVMAVPALAFVGFAVFARRRIVVRA